MTRTDLIELRTETRRQKIVIDRLTQPNDAPRSWVIAMLALLAFGCVALAAFSNSCSESTLEAPAMGGAP